MADKTSKLDRVIAFVSLWVARFALTTLAVAGLLHLLGGIDPMIAYPVTLISVAFLLKETL